MKDLFEYIDYRAYLKDWYEEKKISNSFISYTYIANKLEIDTSNFAKILKKERHLPEISIEKMKHLLNLEEKEWDYLKSLIEFGRCKNKDKCKEIFEKIIWLQGPKRKVIESLSYDFYSKWYHTAIYSFIDFYEFTGDYKELASFLTPSITITEAKESITLLEKLNLISKDSDGKYIVHERNLSTGDKWKSIAIQNYQEETIEIAKLALRKQHKKARDISTVTFTASEEDLKIIRDLTNDYRKAVIKQIEESKKSERVYQLNIQMFPLTKKCMKNDKK